MKYALVDGQRQEAQRGFPGECQSCRSPMVAKCGDIRNWHWAHRGECTGDHWWEPETPWHRAWKDQFPVDWQEYIHEASDGEKHIADVKTKMDWVLEFQHSPLNPAEHRARNAFYKKLAWVVNGERRKRDRSQFFKILKQVASVSTSTLVRRVFVALSEESALLRDWAGGPTPVFFDFGEEPVLWCLLPGSPDGRMYVVEFSRAGFIQLHRDESIQTDIFAEFLKNLCNVVSGHALRPQIQTKNQTLQYGHPRRLQARFHRRF